MGDAAEFIRARKFVSFDRPELAAIHATLDDLSPANAADLTALALCRLDEVARAIRSANTND